MQVLKHGVGEKDVTGLQRLVPDLFPPERDSQGHCEEFIWGDTVSHSTQPYTGDTQPYTAVSQCSQRSVMMQRFITWTPEKCQCLDTISPGKFNFMFNYS